MSTNSAKKNFKTAKLWYKENEEPAKKICYSLTEAIARVKEDLQYLSEGVTYKPPLFSEGERECAQELLELVYTDLMRGLVRLLYLRKTRAQKEGGRNGK